MEYADSLWAHLGGDAETDVTTQAEVDQWLEKLLDEAEDDNLDTEGVDNEPLVETTWNAAARHIQRREAIMARTATGEPDFIEAARRIVANKTYETIDGVVFDGFSASAVLQVWDALGDEMKERMGNLGVAKAVNVAFKLMKSPAVKVTRKKANRASRRRVAASVEIFDESEGYSTTVDVQADSAEAAISEAVRQNPLFCSSGGWAKVDGTTYNWTRTGESDSAGATVSKESWIGDMANRYVDHLFGASRTAADEAVEHSDIQTVEGTGDDDEEELYDDWVHDESEWVDPETGAIRSQPNPRGGPFFESKLALTSIDDDELIDWEERRRLEEESLIDPGPLKRQRYQRELKTHIYSDSQRRSR